MLDSMLDSTLYTMVEQLTQHATAIPSRKFPFSSDQGSQTGLGSTSTRLNDRMPCQIHCSNLKAAFIFLVRASLAVANIVINCDEA